MVKLRTVALVIALPACTRSLAAVGEGSGSGGAAAGTTSSTTIVMSTTTTPGTGAGGGAACTPQSPDPDAGYHPPTCADLSVMTVADPVIDVDGGDMVFPGSTLTLTVTLEEIAGKGFDAYPMVKFTADNPAVTVTSGAEFYAILPCMTMPASASIAVNDVPSGTTVHVKAQVAALNMDCPNASSIVVPIQIF
jgi:hypothetical protein